MFRLILGKQDLGVMMFILIIMVSLIAETSFDFRAVSSDNATKNKCDEYHRAVKQVLSELTHPVPETTIEQVNRYLTCEYPD